MCDYIDNVLWWCVFNGFTAQSCFVSMCHGDSVFCLLCKFKRNALSRLTSSWFLEKMTLYRVCALECSTGKHCSISFYCCAQLSCNKNAEPLFVISKISFHTEGQNVLVFLTKLWKQYRYLMKTTKYLGVKSISLPHLSLSHPHLSSI